MARDKSLCMMDTEAQFEALEIENLPEACVVLILKLTSRRDVARLACVSRAFQEIASSDCVWESFLPNGYIQIIANTGTPIPLSWSKKQVYDYLCKRVLHHGDTQELWLDQNTGGVCRSMSARALHVTWGNDSRYWTWFPRDGSSYAEVACLQSVCWLEVKGDLQGFFPSGTYTFSWRLSLVSKSDESYCRGHIAGWDLRPVTFTLEVDDQDIIVQHYLDPEIWEQNQLQRQAQNQPPAVCRRVHEYWMEYDVGEFTVEPGHNEVSLHFVMKEIEGLHWKRGLVVDGIMIRPSYLIPQIKDNSSGVP